MGSSKMRASRSAAAAILRRRAFGMVETEDDDVSNRFRRAEMVGTCDGRISRSQVQGVPPALSSAQSYKP